MLLAAAVALLLGAMSVKGISARAGLQPSRWIEVGISKEGIRASVDTTSIKPNQDGVHVKQRFLLPPSASRRTAYVDQMVVYDCSSGVVRTLSSTEFDANEQVVRQDGEGQTPSYQVRPDTLPRYIWDVLC
jgi:hypothetical protein